MADSLHVRQDIAAARESLARVRLMCTELRTFGEMIMGLADDISGEVDVLTKSITDIIAAYQADNQTIADLKSQLAAGPPGLTAEQGTALLAKLVASQKTIADALAPAGVTVPQPPPPTP